MRPHPHDQNWIRLDAGFRRAFGHPLAVNARVLVRQISLITEGAYAVRKCSTSFKTATTKIAATRDSYTGHDKTISASIQNQPLSLQSRRLLCERDSITIKSTSQLTEANVFPNKSRLQHLQISIDFNKVDLRRKQTYDWKWHSCFVMEEFT